MNYKSTYENWMAFDGMEESLRTELLGLSDQSEIEDRFYQGLEFGTAGMRGTLGVGTNRMNIYVVARATYGLASYLLSQKQEEAGVAIAYDSRIMSKEFAQVAAQVLAAQGVKAYLFEGLRPVPVLSFTVRHLKTAAGIVITASHNPQQYNGYKVYGPDGAQMTSEAADAVVGEIDKITDYFSVPLAEVDNDNIISIGKEIDDAYTAAVMEVVKPNTCPDLKVIYTPIHGSGNIPVRRVLKEQGFDNVAIVPEQEAPDGRFPTAPYPNPEEKSVFDLAIAMAERDGADIIVGTDPDCDRVGAVCRKPDGDYVVFTGNQTGALMVDYYLKTRDLPDNKTVVKTIVTSELGGVVARANGADVVDVLTGFKYIGECMTKWQETKERTFALGYEESYGYLAGNYARDKDAVIATALICEMAAYYKNKGMTLYDALEALYQKYGYFLEGIQSIGLAGIEGKQKIAAIMESFRNVHFDNFGDETLVEFNDYLSSESTALPSGEKVKIDLPKSNVLKFIFSGKSWYALRPSGTEPKLKIYYSVVGKTRKEAEEKMEILKALVNQNIN